MHGQQLPLSSLEVGDEFTDIAAGSNTFGQKYCLSMKESGATHYYAYPMEWESDDPVQFKHDELVGVAHAH